MFTKKYVIGNYSIELNITGEPFFVNGNDYFFGVPYGNELSVSNVNDLKGYWLTITSNDNELKITNDILGGYRLYYATEGTNIYISDDYNLIISRLSKIEENTIEYQFWLKHGFTTGQCTFIQGLEKLSPASQLLITSKGLIENSYFKDVERFSNALSHSDTIYEDLCDTFKVLKKNTNKKILLFSGGKDSCLLLLLMTKFKIEFTPVFFRLNPMSKHGEEDLIRVKRISKELDIDLEEIEIDLKRDTHSILDSITKTQVFDKHFSLLHYLGNRAIKKKYGQDLIIINGQSSDSILSFGPSEESLMSKFRRYIMYKPSHFISKIGLLLMILKTKKRYKLPKSNEESLLALFDETKYTRVLDQEKSQAYYSYIDKYIQKYTKHLKNYCSKEMYTKILSFCQGSDNQIVVNSSKYYNLKTVMPFATPKIVYATIKYKDEKREIIEPKYVINDILTQKFNFKYGEVLSESKNEFIVKASEESVKKYIKKVDEAYMSTANSLFY